MTDLGTLLASAQKVQEAVGLIKATKGSSLEPARNALFSALNDIVVEILRFHLDKVEVRFDPQRPQRWDDNFAVLEVVYGGYSLKIPTPILRELDGEIAQKVEGKMKPIRVIYYGRSGWGGGREAGGLSYTSEPRITFPDAPEGTKGTFLMTSSVWDYMPNGLASKLHYTEHNGHEVVLYRDHWTGATLAARQGELFLSPEEIKQIALAFEETNPMARQKDATWGNILKAAGLPDEPVPPLPVRPHKVLWAVNRLFFNSHWWTREQMEEVKAVLLPQVPEIVAAIQKLRDGVIERRWYDDEEGPRLPEPNHYVIGWDGNIQVFMGIPAWLAEAIEAARPGLVVDRDL